MKAATSRISGAAFRAIDTSGAAGRRSQPRARTRASTSSSAAAARPKGSARNPSDGPAKRAEATIARTSRRGGGRCGAVARSALRTAAG